jgi:hypothetical protein
MDVADKSVACVNAVYSMRNDVVLIIITAGERECVEIERRMIQTDDRGLVHFARWRTHGCALPCVACLAHAPSV